jgi:hypothetical protein
MSFCEECGARIRPKAPGARGRPKKYCRRQCLVDAMHRRQGLEVRRRESTARKQARRLFWAWGYEGYGRKDEEVTDVAA